MCSTVLEKLYFCIQQLKPVVQVQVQAMPTQSLLPPTTSLGHSPMNRTLTSAMPPHCFTTQRAREAHPTPWSLVRWTCSVGLLGGETTLGVMWLTAVTVWLGHLPVSHLYLSQEIQGLPRYLRRSWMRCRTQTQELVEALQVVGMPTSNHCDPGPFHHALNPWKLTLHQWLHCLYYQT